MPPTHKARIRYSVVKDWFTKIADAHRNPNGDIYKLNFDKLFGTYDKQDKCADTIAMLKEAEVAIKNAAFIISEAIDTDLPDLYLTVIDMEYVDAINENRWKLKLSDNYWHSQSNSLPKLHQRVYEIATGQHKPEGVLHHKNFYTFDNRAKNIADITDVQHGHIHGVSVNIGDCWDVKTTADLLDLIASVFP